MPNYPSIISLMNGKIEVGLPLTSPTGKIRTKNRDDRLFGNPMASRQNNFTDSCYIEWQIGYDDPDPNKTGVEKKISFQRNGELKYGYELSCLLYNGIINDIFNNSILDDLINFATSIDENHFFEDLSPITRRIIDGNMNFNRMIFTQLLEESPLYIYNNNRYSIEVKISHKQKAVGYQAMIYVCLPVQYFIENIIGRKANKKEYIHFNISKSEDNFIVNTFKIFAIASKKHNADIINILKAIKCII